MSAGACLLGGDAAPPKGFILSLPAMLKAEVSADETAIERMERGFVLPPGTRQAMIRLGL